MWVHRPEKTVFQHGFHVSTLQVRGASIPHCRVQQQALRPRAVLYHPDFRDHGGGEMVAAWALQVLGENHEPILWTDHALRIDRINARFQTALSESAIRVVRSPRWLRFYKQIMPGKGRLLRLALTVRELNRVQNRHDPKCWISTYNEMWLPRPGLQYVHWPENHRVSAPPAAWPARRKLAFESVNRLADRIGLGAAAGPEGNRTLVNSHFIKERVAWRLPGARVIYPPVPPFAAGRPWAEREDRVVCLGRWSELKRLEAAVDLVARVRRAGAKDLRLAFVGFWDAQNDYRDMIMRRCAGLDWVEWHERLERPALETLVGSSRYGIHLMVDEHFGIAVAELMTAGCVVLVHDSGGPREIVADKRQCFTDVDAGANLLHQACASIDWQVALHQAARPRGLEFAPDKFCAAFRQELLQLSVGAV